jgi:O-antigen/teichoic acid export membrane protein
VGLRYRGVALLAAGGAATAAHSFMSMLWGLKLGFSLLAVLLIGLGSWLELLVIGDLSLALLTALACVTLPSSSPVVWQLRAAGLQWIESTGLVLYRLALLAVALLPVADALDARLLLVGLIASNGLFLLLMLAGRWYAGRHTGRVSLLQLPSWTRLVAESLPLGMSLLFAQLAPRLWVIWLGLVASRTAVAEFSVAVTSVQSVLMVGVVLSAVFLPLLSRLGDREPDRESRLAQALTEAAILLGSLAGGAMALGAWSIATVVFGEKLSGSGLYIWLLAAVAPLALTSFVARATLATRAVGGSDLGAVVSGMMLGIVVALLCYPGLGAVGLALAYLAAEACTAWLKVRIVFREFRFRWDDLAPATRFAPVALAVTVLAGYVLGHGPAPGLVPLAGVVAGVGALSLAIAGSSGGRRIVRILSEP